MRRALAVLPLLLLTACGGYSPAEQAYLDTIKAEGATIELADPDAKLQQGKTACGVISDFKPGKERDFAIYKLKNDRDFGHLIVTTATTHLCPEVLTP